MVPKKVKRKLFEAEVPSGAQVVLKKSCHKGVSSPVIREPESLARQVIDSSDSLSEDGEDFEWHADNPAHRRIFLESVFPSDTQLRRVGKTMKLAVLSSQPGRRIRFKAVGPKTGKQYRVCTFKYRTDTMAWSRAEGHGAPNLEECLEEWSKQMLCKEASSSEPVGDRRPNLRWTKAGVAHVLNLLDQHGGRRFTLTQITRTLNEPQTKGIYFHTSEKSRKITRNNVSNLIRKMFPPNEDTQQAVAIIEEAKSWAGWEVRAHTHTHTANHSSTHPPNPTPTRSIWTRRRITSWTPTGCCG